MKILVDTVLYNPAMKKKKPIEFIYNGNYTQEEMVYFMEERKRLKGIKKRE